MTGKKIKEKVKLILLNIGFILLSFLTLIPILYAFSISISGSNSIISTEFHILPKTITMDNYITILTERPFGRWFVNSLLLSALTVLLTMLVAVPAAYVFSRMKEDFIYFTGVKCVPGNSLHVCNLSDYQDSESVEFLYGIGIYLCGKYGDFCFLEYEGIF